MGARILSVLLASAACSWAATYHVSPDGDDTRSAIDVQNPSTPWKTLAKAGSARLNPGDSLLLRRGGIWRESLRMTTSGTPAAPVVVAAYGAGEAPRLLGTDSLAGDPQAGRRTASVAKPVKRVFAGGRILPSARFPDTGWIVASRFDTDSAIVAPGLAGTDWTGASIHMRTQRWTLETHRVKSGTGGRLYLDSKPVNPVPDSVRFYLTNHPSAAGAGTDWFQDPASGVLSWTAGVGPVEASVRGPLVDLGGASNVIVAGLSLVGASGSAVWFSGNGVRIERCGIEHPSLVGISVMGGRNGVLVDNLVRGAGNKAFDLVGAGHRVEGNRIRATAMAAEFGPDGMGFGCCGGRSIESSGDSTRMARNDIDSSGYIGIGFRGRSNLIEENTVAHSCMTTDDCGGIYTWSGKWGVQASAGSVIRRNLVRDAVGAQSGWKSFGEASQGIYLDDGTTDVRVDSNTCQGNSIGIFLHNNRQALVRGNICFGNRTAQILASHDKLAGPGDMLDNQVQGNLLVALPGQMADIAADVYQAQSDPILTASGNMACLDQGLYAACRSDGRLVWDRNLVAAGDPRLGPQTQRNGTFDSARLSWSGWPAQEGLSLDSGAACASGKCLRVWYSKDTVARNPLVNCGRRFGIDSGQAWKLSFRARGLDAGQILTPIFRRAERDYAVLGLASRVALGAAWDRYEFLFRATRSDTSVRLDFQNSKTDSLYWLDDVSLRPVPESLLVSLPAARLLANPTSSGIVEPVGAGWIDAWGAALPASVAIPARGAVVAFPGKGAQVQAVPSAVARKVRAQWRSGQWEFSGLLGEARIVDLRGRIVGRIHPDSRGEAQWRPAIGAASLWLVDRGGSTSLFRVP